MKKRAGLARAMVTEREIVLFDEPDSGLDPVRTAEYMGVLFRSNLVKFAAKQEKLTTDNPIIQQFPAGRPEGPIGMDEMADTGADTSGDIEGDTAALRFGPLARPGEVPLAADVPSEQPVPPG